MTVNPAKSGTIPLRDTPPGPSGHPEERLSASGLGIDRLQAILKRFISGYYDSPALLGCLAERLSEEWRPGSA